MANDRVLTFKEWLLKNYSGVDTQFGDLAGDVEHDRTFPEENTRERIHGYLRVDRHACRECLQTFSCAWAAYRRYVKKETGGDA